MKTRLSNLLFNDFMAFVLLAVLLTGTPILIGASISHFQSPAPTNAPSTPEPETDPPDGFRFYP